MDNPPISIAVVGLSRSLIINILVYNVLLSNYPCLSSSSAQVRGAGVVITPVCYYPCFSSSSAQVRGAGVVITPVCYYPCLLLPLFVITPVCLHLQHKCVGRALFSEVVKKLQIMETDYFDLEFTNEHGNSVSSQSQLHVEYAN